MSLLGRYRAGKAIEVILEAPSLKSPEAEEAVERLKQIGPPAIPRLLEALASAHRTESLEAVLAGFVDDSTLPTVRRGLFDRNQQVVSAVARVLSRPGSFDPNALLDLFEDPEAPKAPLTQVLLSHTEALYPATVLRLLDRVDAQARPSLLWLIARVAKPTLVPELIRRLESDDPVVRLALVRTISSFSLLEVQKTLVRVLLADGHSEVRQAALEGLMGLELSPPLAPLCQLLRDPDMVIQGKGIEALVRLRHPDTAAYLSELMQDPKEGVRRAVVEVLNELVTPSALPILVRALRDVDWWVQVRAVDALVSLGGARMVEAVLPLLDAEEPVRRAVLEVLERTKDEHALSFLIDTLEAPDPQVRERSVAALAALGDARAVPYLLPLLERHPQSSRAVVAALGELGDSRAVPSLVATLEESEEVDLRREVLVALEKLADAENAPRVLEALESLEPAASGELRRLGREAAARLEERYRHTQPAIAVPSFENGGGDDGSDDLVLDLSRSDPAPTIIDALTLRPGDVLADRYRIIRQVGKGGFGVVLLVEDRIVQDDIILKFLGAKLAVDRAWIERFKHELRLARKITHQNVIRIYDLISFGGSFAISMEYFESHSLASELREGQPLELGRALAILREIVSGLGVAHRANVIHRDLKPGNILINDRGEVKIVDFGLAAAASRPSSGLTRSGSLIGTPTYMSPEQIRGQSVDARSDLYSLGILMYELFTGRAPYRASDTLAVLFQHIEGQPRPPRELNPKISQALERLTLKAISVDPAQRQQSTAELLAELDAAPEMEAS